MLRKTPWNLRLRFQAQFKGGAGGLCSGLVGLLARPSLWKADHAWLLFQNHWFTYNETMTVESVTQAVSNLALQFGEEDADPGAMVSGACVQFPGCSVGPRTFVL